MTKTINGNEAFQIMAHSFSVSPSNEGYTLEYSADGVGYTAWDEATPANETLFVVDIPKNAYFRLSGNNTELTISY